MRTALMATIGLTAGAMIAIFLPFWAAMTIAGVLFAIGGLMHLSGW